MWIEEWTLGIIKLNKEIFKLEEKRWWECAIWSINDCISYPYKMLGLFVSYDMQWER